MQLSWISVGICAESGVVLQGLNNQLASLKLKYGPDPATADRCTFGGMIGNNSTGTHSILYGMTADHIKRLEVVLSDGEKLWLDSGVERLTVLRDHIRNL